jgi:hypothetical protein
LRRAREIARLKDYIAEDDIGGQLAAMASEDDIDEQSMLDAIALDDDCASDGTAEAARAPTSRSRAAIEICFFIFDLGTEEDFTQAL